MDDSAGIVLARSRGLKVIRTPGIYMLAKEKGLIEAVVPAVRRLQQQGFWINKEVMRAIAIHAGETLDD